MPALRRPESSWWATRLLQPSKSPTANDPVPHTEAAKSCGPAVMTAAASCGGGSCNSAHWVNPRYDAPIVANRPVNQGCSTSHAAVSAPSVASLTIGSKTPAEPAHTLQHDVVAARRVRLGEQQRERKSAPVGSAQEHGADGAGRGRCVVIGDQPHPVAHRHFNPVHGVTGDRRPQPQQAAQRVATGLGQAVQGGLRGSNRCHAHDHQVRAERSRTLLRREIVSATVHRAQPSRPPRRG